MVSTKQAVSGEATEADAERMEATTKRKGEGEGGGEGRGARRVGANYEGGATREMREIKFRAWHKDGEMFYCCPLNTLGEHAQFGADVVLMQYTGLKDKNDREIYEGDKIQFSTIKEEDEKKR